MHNTKQVLAKDSEREIKRQAFSDGWKAAQSNTNKLLHESRSDDGITYLNKESVGHIDDLLTTRLEATRS